jgi:hypothetical protein
MDRKMLVEKLLELTKTNEATQQSLTMAVQSTCVSLGREVPSEEEIMEESTLDEAYNEANVAVFDEIYCSKILDDDDLISILGFVTSEVGKKWSTVKQEIAKRLMDTSMLTAKNTFKKTSEDMYCDAALLSAGSIACANPALTVDEIIDMVDHLMVNNPVIDIKTPEVKEKAHTCIRETFAGAGITRPANTAAKSVTAPTTPSDMLTIFEKFAKELGIPMEKIVINSQNTDKKTSPELKADLGKIIGELFTNSFDDPRHSWPDAPEPTTTQQ